MLTLTKMTLSARVELNKKGHEMSKSRKVVEG
jgi:hypothetical protein